MSVSRALGSCLLALGLAACVTAPDLPPSAEDLAAGWGPIVPGAYFHHVHLNVKSRESSIVFYTKHFDARRARFAGQEDAIWAQRSWLLFSEGAEAPLPQSGMAIGHFGWGAPDASAEFQRQKSLGASFQTELRDISVGLGGKASQFHFMYVRGPVGELIEINTDPDNNFGHIHLSSADAIATGAWYRNMFGLEAAPPYFDGLVIQTGSGRTSRHRLAAQAPANVIAMTNPSAMPATTIITQVIGEKSLPR